MFAVSETKNYFLKSGKPWFYLADTVWAAFTNPSIDEWEEYLDYRQVQGFNALQINILPQWDRSQASITIHPFVLKADGTYDYHEIQEEYFIKAKRMLDIATEKGFTPALVLLWCNYVKDTWAAKRMPEHVMPLEAVKPYVRYAAETFAPYNPFYLVSGDTNFGGDSDTYYQVALQTLREVDPKALTALHIQPAVQIPKSFIDDPALDFYIYQSGHTVHEQHLAYKSAEQFLSTSVKRPIINGEPCYEAHGYGNAYGRFTASDVRKAVWHSLLSGANAGITYGAHGIWSFHRKGDHFPNEGFANTPLDWRTALRLPGGWDTAYAKWIFEHYELYDVEPVCFSDNAAEQIRMAITKDKTKAAIYVPANIQVNLGKDLSDYQRWEAINLSNRYVFVPEVKFAAGKTVIDIHPFNTDVLIIGLSD